MDPSLKTVAGVLTDGSIHGVMQAAARLDPWFSLALFLLTSALMIWRLGALEGKGLEGTVLGTLVMPYCSGFSNLAFAWIMGRSAGDGSQVLENCLVNNATNLTLLIGLPALIWPLHLATQSRARKAVTAYQLSFLALVLTLLAMLFFTGLLWSLGRDGRIDFGDGLALTGSFLFWQVFQVFDVMKQNIQRRRTLPKSILADLAVIVLAAVGMAIGIDRLVEWVTHSGSGWLVSGNLGWLSGFLMVLPNALLAFYYAGVGRADVVYSSQVGDGHICIPMCIGLFALFAPIRVTPMLQAGVVILVAAGAVHLFCMLIFRRLPRWVGAALAASYAVFLALGVFQ
jgi:cation:H+ antiporter